MAVSISIRSKCVLLACGSAAVALILACAGFAINGVNTLSEAKLRELSDQVKMVAFHASPVLTLRDRAAGERLLASFNADPTVESACVVDTNWQEIAALGSPAGDVSTAFQAEAGSRAIDYINRAAQWLGGSPKRTQEGCRFIDFGQIEVIQPVVVGNQNLGHIYARANTTDMQKELLDFARIAGYVLATAMLMAFLLSFMLQRGISRPVVALTQAAQRITVADDYSIRVGLTGGAELATLQGAFNQMLDHIQKSDESLQNAHSELEERVIERTQELSLEIARRKQTLIDLERAKEAAEAANRAKSEFLANISHEIRTPLNSIIGFTDLMLRDDKSQISAEQLDSLESIQRGGQHLTELINDVLDLSKIEAGRLEVERIAFSPHEVISEVVSQLRMRAEEKGLTLSYEWSTPLPEKITSDPSRVRQMLLNLVGNAIKFTEKGSIRVVTSMTGSLDRRLRVEVIDTGIGIPESKLESIFDPFMQADTSVTRRFGGTGLGLAISRKIAIALNGELSVTSKVKEGSRFAVLLDPGPLRDVKMLASPPAVTQANLSHVNQVHSLPPSNILVVEDGETNRKLVRLILQRAGATITTADDGKQALDAVEKKNFDLVLMDMQMPVLDGYSATRMLRDRGFKLPIIALTAHAMKGDEEKCRLAGCSGYLTKPIDSGRLLSALSPILEHLVPSTPQDSGEGKPHPATAPSPAPPQANGLRSTAAGVIYSTLPMDDDEFREIVKEFIGLARERVGEMRQAWIDRQFEQLRSLAHWLKGAGGSAGFPVYTEPAKSLELLARDQRLEEADACLKIIQGITNKIAVPPAPEGAEVVSQTS